MFFHGQVTVQRTGMLEHRTLTNGFVENGGKPWEKGWIESAFNLMHNLAGSLPGQKGARYDLAPASTAARVLYCERLLDEKAGLTDDQIAQLRLPVESLDELITAYERLAPDARNSLLSLLRALTAQPGEPVARRQTARV